VFEFGIVRVSEEYDGYTITRRITGAPDRRGLNEVSLQEEQYFALGDNSDDSADSRMWGTVPEQNLLGPGLMVYWPLEHWGRIH
jgi:signal peptidase I